MLVIFICLAKSDLFSKESIKGSLYLACKQTFKSILLIWKEFKKGFLYLLNFLYFILYRIKLIMLSFFEIIKNQFFKFYEFLINYYFYFIKFIESQKVNKKVLL